MTHSKWYQSPQPCPPVRHWVEQVADQLLQLDLPEPLVLKKLQLREQDQKIISDWDVKLSSMRMADPKGQSLLGQLAIMYAAKKHP
ncbi:hypothetical protein CROQUDRAFT_94501 [Cronartium quercuum f. sp. fusiforme G11]|uniref:Uncharacterized protein n=1 Tax=Cronartium quercuum f. sp. fusiforme G11 TaxID=708437 RepID=A0A9P6NIV7_9BASI|nr:hypothetical protein CROQUDRAFT_94501 [Cronartium quercuum f. sp. fusiforme G11]